MQQKKNVVGYCRVSTLEQKKKGYGIAIQVRDIERYAQERGWRIAAWYKDEAKTGVIERRKALQRLRRDCKAGTVHAIIMAKLDRFSRSLRLSENLFYEFEQWEVAVYIAEMPHYDAHDRKEVLMRQIQAAIAEENRKEIIERLKKGREERVRKGKMSGGTLPYGYARCDKDVRVNSREAEVIHLIFQLYSQQLNDQEIATTLSAQGYRRRNGMPWTQRQVWAIVHRRALYAEGMIQYGTVVSKDVSLILLK